MPPCLRNKLGTAKWWVRASLLTGGTEARITMETAKSINKKTKKQKRYEFISPVLNKGDFILQPA